MLRGKQMLKELIPLGQISLPSELWMLRVWACGSDGETPGVFLSAGALGLHQ